MTYPQQPFGGEGPHGQGPQYGGYGYGGGFGAPPPPPPEKKNTGAIIAVVAVVVLLLGGLGFTGFVAPGFFLSSGGTTPTPQPTTTRTTASSPAPQDDPEKFLKALAASLSSRDSAALEEITCSDARSSVKRAIDDIESVRKARLIDSETGSGDEAEGVVEVTSAGRTSEFKVTIIRDGRDWCWRDIVSAPGRTPSTSRAPSTTPGAPTAPTAGGKPVDPEALAAMQSFLDSVNAGDAAKAKSHLCADGIKGPKDVDEMLGHKPQLEIDPAMEGISSGPHSVQLYLRGMAGGKKIGGYSTNLWVVNYDGPWCVHAFRLIVV